MSSTMRSSQVVSSSSASSEPYDAESAYAERGAGWVAFSGVMLVFGGFVGLMFGIVALARSSFYVGDAHYVFSDLRTWGWITTIAACLAMLAGFYVFMGSQWARWLGIVVAAGQALAQLLVIQAYPFWSLCVFAVDVLVIYGLAAYGGKKVSV